MLVFPLQRAAKSSERFAFLAAILAFPALLCVGELQKKGKRKTRNLVTESICSSAAKGETVDPPTTAAFLDKARDLPRYPTRKFLR